MEDKIMYSMNKKIDVKKIDLLYKELGGNGPRGAKKWEKILSKSSFVCSAWKADKLVGFGRIVEDGTMCMFYDIVVAPIHQRKGIGTQIMNCLIDKIKDKRYLWIGLFTSKQGLPLYKKLDFKKVNNGMILKKYMTYKDE